MIIRVTGTAGYNGVISGIFFGSASTSTAPSSAGSATYSGLDTKTQGAWTTQYGADGDFIANNASNAPAYATVNLAGDSLWTWANSTTDPRALTTNGGNGIASCYAGSSFTINVNISDGNAHKIALYLLDWDSTTRAETISILDGTTHAVLDTETFANFNNGEYASWNIKGNVIIQVTVTGGINAVVSGIFFGPATTVTTPPPTPATAAYGGLDTKTQGTWTGNYGASGYLIANGANALPAFATANLTGQGAWTFTSSTSDPRALQIASGSATRIASTYYSNNGSFAINVSLTDGKSHRIALYLLDWDTTARAETITIMDASTHTVLNTQSYAGFQNGEYASWNITGSVIIQVTETAGINAVAAGIFVD